MARLNWTRLLGRGALAAILALAGGVTLGQTPTAAQMEAFRNLTPEQQQAIMEQMGGSGQAGSASQRSRPRFSRDGEAEIHVRRRH